MDQPRGFDPIAAALTGTQRPDARYYGGTAPAKTLAELQNARPMDRIFRGRREVRIGMKFLF